MKMWLARLRISVAADLTTSLPKWVQRQLDRSPELRRQYASVLALDRSLRQPLPVNTPSLLHSRIMQAVRAERSRPAATASHLGWRWLTAPAGAVVILLGLLCLTRPAREGHAPAVGPALTALDLGRQLTQTVPIAAVQPLTEEWLRVNRDLEGTARFLLASMP